MNSCGHEIIGEIREQRPLIKPCLDKRAAIHRKTKTVIRQNLKLIHRIRSKIEITAPPHREIIRGNGRIGTSRSPRIVYREFTTRQNRASGQKPVIEIFGAELSDCAGRQFYHDRNGRNIGRQPDIIGNKQNIIRICAGRIVKRKRAQRNVACRGRCGTVYRPLIRGCAGIQISIPLTPTTRRNAGKRCPSVGVRTQRCRYRNGGWHTLRNGNAIDKRSPVL